MTDTPMSHLPISDNRPLDVGAATRLLERMASEMDAEANGLLSRGADYHGDAAILRAIASRLPQLVEADALLDTLDHLGQVAIREGADMRDTLQAARAARESSNA